MLARSYHDAGRLEEAIKLREEVQALHRQADGLEHHGTLQAMNNLANSYQAAGRWVEALNLGSRPCRK